MGETNRACGPRAIAGLLAALFVGGHGTAAAQAVDLKDLLRQSSPAVVTVATLDGRRQLTNSGSGFLISPDGILVTNHHVIRGAHELVAQLESGESFSADRVLGLDCEADLAVLQLRTGAARLPFLRLGRSEAVEVGEQVIAIGSPAGLSATVSEGIISGIREISGSGVRLLQTTAAVSSGSSGGPLMRRDAQVIGVASYYLEGGQNLNFAVPSEYIVSILRSPAPAPLRSAGIECEPSPLVTSMNRGREEQQAEIITNQIYETVGSLIDFVCRREAVTYRGYQDCVGRHVVQVRGLMSYLFDNTKNAVDVTKILVKCDNSWSRHGELWNFNYLDVCIRSETRQYRLRGNKVN